MQQIDKPTILCRNADNRNEAAHKTSIKANIAVAW